MPFLLKEDKVAMVAMAVMGVVVAPTDSKVFMALLPKARTGIMDNRAEKEERGIKEKVEK